jgi:flagellar biosynthesis chaperone FliJ
MKFNFRFASILKLRRHQEKMEKQQLSKLFRKKAMLKEQHDELRQQNLQGVEVKESQSIITVRQQYEQKHARQKQMSALKQQLVELDIAVEQQRWKLAEANKETRKLEKLKSNEKQAFIEDAEHEEQLQQNEIAIQRFNQN